MTAPINNVGRASASAAVRVSVDRDRVKIAVEGSDDESEYIFDGGAAIVLGQTLIRAGREAKRYDTDTPGATSH